MREIKFMAFDKENNKMIGPFEVGSKLSEIWPPEMQYIGKKDDNGTEIYEGFILKFKDHEGHWEKGGKILTHWPNIGVVFWDAIEAKFNCTDKDTNNQPNWWLCSEKEVIGNICQNKGFLEEDKEND